MSTSSCRAHPAAGGTCMPDDGGRISSPDTARAPATTTEAPQGWSDHATKRPYGPPSAPTFRPRPWPRRVLFLLLPFALIGGGYRYVIGGHLLSTDDAYVEADKVGISTDVSGIVKEVDVAENQ